MKKIIGISLLTFTIMMPYHLSAAGIDGSSPLLCAVTEALGCGPEDGCVEGTAESINIPQFFRIDFGNGKISTPEGSKEKRESEIKYFKGVDGALIFQGVEGIRGWNIVVEQDTGNMSATASAVQGGFVIFGACIPD